MISPKRNGIRPSGFVPFPFALRSQVVAIEERMVMDNCSSYPQPIHSPAGLFFSSRKIMKLFFSSYSFFFMAPLIKQIVSRS